ncbi:MAG: ATP-binding protein [Xanthobacteraceae bacterium]
MQEANTQGIVHYATQTARNVRDEIAFVQTVMQSVIEDDCVPPDVRNQLALIKAMVGGAAQFAKQFMITAAPQDDIPAMLNVHAMILQLTQLIRRLLGKHNRLQISLDGDGLWPIQGDVWKMNEMLICLVVNAREAMPAGGTLCIRARNVTKAQCQTRLRTPPAPADHVLIEVADDGIGMPDDMMRRLFEPFATTKGPGRGFGLAKVRHTVRTLNGQIFCRLGAERGTTFEIFLPAPRTETAHHARRP